MYYYQQMPKKIRTLGYKNALFVGQTDEKQRPQGVGIVIDDMFLTCLAKWSSDPLEQSSTNIKPSGPVLLLYPHRQIFYSDNFPSGKKFEGFWCYETPEYRIIGHGENKNISIMHVNSNVISHIRVNDTTFEHQQDLTYQDEHEKWDKVSQITSKNIQNYKKSVQLFIQHCFLRSMNKDQVQQNFICVKNKRQEFLYGIMSKNQGSAICLKRQAEKLSTVSTGFYQNFDPSRQISFGRKYFDQINSTSYSIQEGNFDTGAVHIFQYTEKRPSESYKNSRKYFRQMTNFCNQFLQFSQADQIYKKLGNIKKWYTNLIDSKYGQKIIEGEKQQDEDQERPEKQAPISRKQQYKQANIVNRQYNLEEAKARIQEEVYKKKMLGSTNRTGAFLNPEIKSAYETKNKNYEESSPILKYKLNSEQQTKRYERSPKNTPRKFKYTDRQDQPETNEWKREPTAYVNTQNHYKSPSYPVTKPRQEKITNFTLYTANRQNTEPQRKKYNYELETKNPRLYQPQSAYNQIDRKIERQIQEKLERYRQQDRQNDRRKIQEYKRTILGNLTSYRTSSPVKKGQPEPHYQHRTNIPNFTSRQHETGRKHFSNYRYTQEQNKDYSYKSPIQLQNRAEMPSISPIKRITTEANTNMKKRQVSKSPSVNTRNTARKIYSYVD